MPQSKLEASPPAPCAHHSILLDVGNEMGMVQLVECDISLLYLHSVFTCLVEDFLFDRSRVVLEVVLQKNLACCSVEEASCHQLSVCLTNVLFHVAIDFKSLYFLIGCRRSFILCPSLYMITTFLTELSILSILLACKQVYQEVNLVFQSLFTFSVHDSLI